MSPAATTLSLFHDGKAVRGAAREVNVLLDEQHGEVLHPVQAQNHLFDFFDDVGLDAFGRLIEQKDFRFGGKRARDRELLLLPAGEHAAAAVEIMDQIGEQLGHETGDRALAVSARKGAHQDIFADRKVGDDLAALRHVGEAAAGAAEGRLAGNVAVVVSDRAVGPVGQPHDGLEQRGLAGAVAAQDGRDLADRHVEIDAVQHVAAVVKAVDLDELEHQLIALDPRYASLTFGFCSISVDAAFGEDLAEMHHGDAFRDLAHEGHVVLDHQQGVLALERIDDLRGLVAFPPASFRRSARRAEAPWRFAPSACRARAIGFARD